MHWQSIVLKIWAYISIAVVVGVVLFLFGYVLSRGASAISWEFLTQAPKGAVLGQEGGIMPAIVGSLWFTVVACILGAIPAIASAIYLTFICTKPAIASALRATIQLMSGIPSIVLGLFAYSLLIRDLGWGRCILSSSVALAIMILPFIEVRVEKGLRELPTEMVESALALGCSMFYTIRTIVLPASRGSIWGAITLGACYAMGATAPLIFTGAVAFADVPTSVMQPAMALPLHLYLLVAQGHTSLDLAYGTAFVMMALVLIGNIAVWAYSRWSVKQWMRS
ncbi:MAG: PstA family ABC transporter permease [Atopobiaceae bacterium]|jgi:phosphate transport system permease protein